jgi:transcriptional regulator with XRE-family HTH domain
MNYWATSSTRPETEVDLEVLEESALAMAQSTIQNAINQSGISQSELARRMDRDRSFVSRILSGSHNLTIKTMARSMAACGFEVRFEPVRIQWNWVAIESTPIVMEEALPANAGSTMLIVESVSTVVPALAG